MELANELENALAEVCAAGPAEVHENGEWLASLDGLQYRVRPQGNSTLLHLWGAQESLVRRVIRVAEQSPERVVLEVSRFGRARPAKLEFRPAVPGYQSKRWGREQFRGRREQLLKDRFPDEIVDSLATGADFHHSISGSYARGVMHCGADSYAVLSAAPEEGAATIDGILTFGLIWLDRIRSPARGESVRGLRIFLPRGTSAITAHRLTGLASPQEIELYEYDPLHWRMRRIPISDAGNLATWLVPRREVDQALTAALPEVERIRCLAPEAICVAVAAPTHDVTMRFCGLEFACWRQGTMWFGLGDHQEVLTPARWPALQKLVHQLETCRHPLATDTKHRLYRAQPERWLETMVVSDPPRIVARLDARHIYAQVPASSASDRGIIDL